jgi:uncharacterized protein (DUF1697 family)
MRTISILRGINVSGQKIIKMADLKALYESLGFEDVVTYIQSGNVIFNSPEKSGDALKRQIETAIADQYTFQIPVIIRNHREIQNILKTSPFGPIDIETDGTKALVTFLSDKPTEARIADLQQQVAPPEQLHIQGKEAYLLCPNGYGKTKLSNTFLAIKPPLFSSS